MGKLQSIKVLTDSEIEMVHETALRVLSEVGISLSEPILTARMKEAGAWLAKTDGYVCISRDMVETALKKATHHFSLYDRRGGELALNAGNHYHASGSGNLRVEDYPSGQIRTPNLDDMVNFTRLGDALPLFKGVTPHFLQLDQNVHPDVEELYIFQAMVKNTGKQCWTAPRNERTGRAWLDLGNILAGEHKLSERPVIHLLVASTAPLSWDVDSVRNLVLGAERGVPVVILGGPICGASAPLTLAGALVNRTAEWLFGLTLAQIIHPGAPIILGDVGSSILDMRTADLGSGGPEYALSSIAGVQMADFYDLPSYSCTPWTDSKAMDAQFGAESLGGWLSAVASGVDISLNAGSLNKVTTGSLEAMIIHHELLQWMERYVAGITVDEETLAFEAIQRVGPSGSFLSDKHTRTWLRKGENVYLKVFDRTAVSAVKKDLLEVAHARVEELLKDHQPDVPASLCQEIDDYVREVEPTLNNS
jgi:trimethylamine---corrinoid protein Co-methyltransferase